MIPKNHFNAKVGFVIQPHQPTSNQVGVKTRRGGERRRRSEIDSLGVNRALRNSLWANALPLPLSLSPSLPLSPQWQMSPAFRLLFNGPLHRRATEGGRERSRDSSTRPPRPPQQKQRKVELFLGGIAVSNPPARSHRSAPLLASPLLSSPLVFPARRGVGSTEVGLNARTR